MYFGLYQKQIYNEDNSDTNKSLDILRLSLDDNNDFFNYDIITENLIKQTITSDVVDDNISSSRISIEHTTNVNIIEEEEKILIVKEKSKEIIDKIMQLIKEGYIIVKNFNDKISLIRINLLFLMKNLYTKKILCKDNQSNFHHKILKLSDKLLNIITKNYIENEKTNA